MQNNPIFSTHAFLFPFRWERNGKNEIELFKSALQNAGWAYRPFRINTEKDYNEFVYFYEYARDALYNTENEFKPNQTTYHFEYPLQNGKYIIKIKDRETPFQLDIESVSLKLYETGIAILSFQTENRIYPEKADIKLINDYGRRIYPQFLPLDAVQGTFLAEYIEIKAEKLALKETFAEYTDIRFDITQNQNPAYLPEFISGLLGDAFTNNKNEKDKFFVDPVIDDRMYVICWYGNDEEAERLSRFDKETKKYVYASDPFWHELIFIDGKEASCTSETMLPELLENHTYNRWAGQATLFGISRYSFILLTKRGWFPENILLTHLKTMYHQLVVLTLAQRASVLNFSKRVTEISKLEGEVANKISRLHKDFIRFINKMYFNEVTAQEQGIELYSMMLKTMNIKENVRDAENEINALHDFAELEQNKKTNRAVHMITLIGLYLLLPTFVTGFFGMNIFNNTWLQWNKHRPEMLIVYFIASLAVAGIIHFIVHIKNKRNATK